jgi:signal peptidase I
MLADMSENRPLAIAIAAVTAVVGAAIAIYLINPFDTASDDPRARIIGYTLYRIPSRSMEPTLHEGAIFVVSAAALRNRDPRVGEIAVFRYPPDPAITYVKRVVATGGTTIELRKGALYVDGESVDEPWLPADPIRTFEMNGETVALREEDIHADMAPLAVPKDHFFVLGDNRGNSSDSRVWGLVRREDMIGIVAED